MELDSMNHKRLSDRILYALELAVHQEDLKTAETLNKAFELSMTRMSGGEGFTERRDFASDAEDALRNLNGLRVKD